MLYKIHLVIYNAYMTSSSVCNVVNHLRASWFGLNLTQTNLLKSPMNEKWESEWKKVLMEPLKSIS